MLLLGLLLLPLAVLGQATTSCKMPVGGRNYAKNGVATQSSVYGGTKIIPGPHLAIDGNTDSNYMQGSCVHTQYDQQPFWSVEMLESVLVDQIVITNRNEVCCRHRLLGAQIRVGDSPDRNNPLCGVIDDVSQETIVTCCGGMSGRYVDVVLPRQEYLHFCEMQVFGHIVAPKVNSEHALEQP